MTPELPPPFPDGEPVPFAEALEEAFPSVDEAATPGVTRDLAALLGEQEAMADAQAEPAATDAASAATPAAAAPDRSFLEVTVANARFGIDLAAVVETGRLPKLTKVPNTPPWVAGVGEVRGEVLAVLDVARLLDLPAGTDPGRLVVVRGRDGAPVGLRVQKLHSMTRVEASLTGEGGPLMKGPAGRFITGAVPRDRSVLTLLSVERMLDETAARRP